MQILKQVYYLYRSKQNTQQKRSVLAVLAKTLLWVGVKKTPQMPRMFYLKELSNKPLGAYASTCVSKKCQKTTGGINKGVD